MTSLTHDKTMRLPRIESREHMILKHLLVAPGTFYQISERADFDIEPAGTEASLRKIFDGMVQRGTASLNGIMYSITPSARAALAPPGEQYVGQVATPHHRGPGRSMSRGGASGAVGLLGAWA